RDAGAFQSRLVEGRFQQALARGAARQRPLQDRELRDGPLYHLSARSELLGKESAGQSRALQLRHRALRLLSRSLDRARSLQGRAIRYPRGECLEELGRRL